MQLANFPTGADPAEPVTLGGRWHIALFGKCFTKVKIG